MNEPTVSIIICTRNNAESLKHTLQCVAQCVSASRETAEIIVVDNGSTDTTREVVAGLSNSGSQLSYVSEPTVGQCFARNAGIGASKGRVLLFTDDDVRPAANWVDGMSLPITSGRADAVAGGISIAPHLLRPWMTAGHRASLFNSADMPGKEGGPELVGANMAIGRHVFDAVPGFDPELGPGRLGFWDDALVGCQLLSLGMRLAGHPEVRVEHHFDPGRLGRRPFLTRVRAHGRSDAYVRYHYYHNRVKVPAPRAAILWLKLWAWRVFHPSVAWTSGAFDLREGRLAYDVHVAWALWQEQKRPRNYALKGVRKVNGVQVTIPVRLVETATGARAAEPPHR